MGVETKIQWTDHTFNPWRGCTKVAPGCANCYAEREAKRFPDNRGIWGPNGTRVRASDAMWKEPLKWNAACLVAQCDDCGNIYPKAPKTCKCGCTMFKSYAKTQGRPRVFCASLADVFEDWQGPVLDHNGRELWFRAATHAQRMIAGARRLAL